MGPMLEQIRERYDQLPGAMLVDSGFTTHADIETAPTAAVEVYGPIEEEKKQLNAGKDPYRQETQDSDGAVT